MTDRHRELRHGFLALSMRPTCWDVQPRIDPMVKTRGGIIHASWGESSDAPPDTTATCAVRDYTCLGAAIWLLLGREPQGSEATHASQGVRHAGPSRLQVSCHGRSNPRSHYCRLRLAVPRSPLEPATGG